MKYKHCIKNIQRNIQCFFLDVLPGIPDDPISPGGPGRPGGPGIASQGPEKKMSETPLGEYHGCM